MAAPINPKGAKSDKIWRAAVMRAVRRLETDEAPKDTKPEQRLERLADQLVEKGLTGDVPALREIGDRLDGKPMQTVAHTEVPVEDLLDQLDGTPPEDTGEPED